MSQGAPRETDTDAHVSISRAATGVNAHALARVLADPGKAPSWSGWITKIEPASSDIWHAQTLDGPFLLAWWYRPAKGELILQFKFGYYPTEARYRLAGEGGQARLEAEFPLPPPGWPCEPAKIGQRLEAELEALLGLAK